MPNLIDLTMAPDKISKRAQYHLARMLRVTHARRRHAIVVAMIDQCVKALVVVLGREGTAEHLYGLADKMAVEQREAA